MNITVYGIPNCDTIKKATSWLSEKKIEFNFHDYKKLGIDDTTLHNWFSQKQITDIINLRSTTWKELPESEKKKIDNTTAIIDVIKRNTSIIKRPIVTQNNRIVLIGFKVEAFESYFFT